MSLKIKDGQNVPLPSLAVFLTEAAWLLAPLNVEFLAVQLHLIDFRHTVFRVFLIFEFHERKGALE